MQTQKKLMDFSITHPFGGGSLKEGANTFSLLHILKLKAFSLTNLASKSNTCMWNTNTGRQNTHTCKIKIIKFLKNVRHGHVHL